MGTPSLQPFLKSYWLTPVKWLANCRKACKYDELDSINAMPATIISESSTSPWIRDGFSMQDLRGTHRTAGSSPSLRRLPGPGPRRGGAGRVRLRTLRGPAGPPRCGSRPVRGGAHCRQRAAGEPPLSWRRERRLAVPPNPTVASFPISFPEDCFRPPSNIEGFVAFGHEEGDEAMSISASEKEDWAGSEPEQLGSSEPSGLQEELMRVLSKAVQELELTWNPPEEPVRSKLDSWYFRSTRKADSRASVPFFPDVHEQLVKTWSAPQSVRVHSNMQAMFSHVDGRRPTDMCALPPSRRPLLHTCVLQQRRP